MQDILLQEYALLDDYKDEQREITMFKDDVVEILDISKPEKWLVKTKYKNLIQVTNRSSAYQPAIFIYLNELLFLLFVPRPLLDRHQVCYIPPKLLEPIEKGKIQLPDLEYQRQFGRVKVQPKSDRKLEIPSISMNNNDAATSSTIYTKSATRSPSTLVEADQQPMADQKTKSLESLTSTIVPNDDLGGQAVTDPAQAPSTIELPVVIADKSKAGFYDDAWLSLRLDLNGLLHSFAKLVLTDSYLNKKNQNFAAWRGF